VQRMRDNIRRDMRRKEMLESLHLIAALPEDATMFAPSQFPWSKIDGPLLGCILEKGDGSLIARGAKVEGTETVDGGGLIRQARNSGVRGPARSCRARESVRSRRERRGSRVGG
jgi:hypothetical protein